MTWHGHRFAFRVRVDVEHVEAQRYIGDYRLTRVAVSNLLDTLAEVDVTVSFAVLGITAELYPNLIADIVGRGHEVYGHGMFHREAFAGRTLADQRHEVDRMRSSIHRACGVQVDGLACPHHGSADENTLRAAAEGGLTFVGSRHRAEGSASPRWRDIAGTDLRVVVPGADGRGASDYTDRRPDWAGAHEEVFSPDGARDKWIANIDWAEEHGRMTTLVIHPWMLAINAGEVQVVKDVLRYARGRGAWFATVAGLIDMASDEA